MDGEYEYVRVLVAIQNPAPQSQGLIGVRHLGLQTPDKPAP